MTGRSPRPRRRIRRAQPRVVSTETLEVAGITITVLRKTGLKNMYLRVKPPRGNVVITAPRGVPRRALRDFALAHLDTIGRGRERIERQTRDASSYATGETHYLWGRPLTLEVSDAAHTSVRACGESLIMALPAGSTQQEREGVLTEWYREQLKLALPAAIRRCEANTGLAANEYRVKKMRTRWGTCNPRAKRIWLSINLAKKPERCLDYVLTHELVHLVERGHTPRFHALVARYFPGHEEAERVLKAPRP